MATSNPARENPAPPYSLEWASESAEVTSQPPPAHRSLFWRCPQPEHGHCCPHTSASPWATENVECQVHTVRSKPSPVRSYIVGFGSALALVLFGFTFGHQFITTIKLQLDDKYRPTLLFVILNCIDCIAGFVLAIYLYVKFTRSRRNV